MKYTWLNCFSIYRKCYKVFYNSWVNLLCLRKCSPFCHIYFFLSLKSIKCQMSRITIKILIWCSLMICLHKSQEYAALILKSSISLSESLSPYYYFIRINILEMDFIDKAIQKNRFVFVQIILSLLEATENSQGKK
jgi:hypothetical protein